MVQARPPFAPFAPWLGKGTQHLWAGSVPSAEGHGLAAAATGRAGAPALRGSWSPWQPSHNAGRQGTLSLCWNITQLAGVSPPTGKGAQCGPVSPSPARGWRPVNFQLPSPPARHPLSTRNRTQRFSHRKGAVVSKSLYQHRGLWV